MTYYILAKQFDGELIQVSTEPLEQGAGQIVICRDGDIPDLSRFEWHGGSLAFIEKAPRRLVTKLSFTHRLTSTELATIYTQAKTNVAVEIWLEMFKAAEEIDLDYKDTVNGVAWLESIGILEAGRAAEILA